MTVTGYPEVSLHEYVDHMTFCQTCSDTEHTSLIQQQLRCLQEWSSKNNMNVNTSKCQVMIPCFQRLLVEVPSFHIGDSVINQTDCV